MPVSSERRWPRLMTAMVTPFDADLRLDTGAAAELAERLVERGAPGVVLAGSTGESATVGDEEKMAMCRAVRARLGARGTVVLNVGTNSTAASARLAAAAQEAGADGVMAVVPYYNRPPQEGLRAHFGAIAASTPLPVMLYNVPGRTAANLLPATLGAIAAEHANVVAIKEASPDLEQAAEIVRTLPSPFLLYSGDDARTLPLMALGGYGVVSVASQLVPERMAALVAAAAEGRIEAARRLHLELTPLFRALFITTNPIPVKVMLGLAGFPVGGFRLPLCAPGAAELEQLRAAVDRYRLAASFA